MTHRLRYGNLKTCHQIKYQLKMQPLWQIPTDGPFSLTHNFKLLHGLEKKEKDNNLDIVRLEEKQMLRKLERAMENGESLMIENLKESIPAILNPVISRATVKKGEKTVREIRGFRS